MTVDTRDDTPRETTIKKVVSAHSPHGEMGQTYLVSGEKLAMRLWQDEPAGVKKPPRVRSYETVGYVIAGRATCHIDGEAILLEPGDSWLVPAGADHSYTIEEPFTAVEATAPPARTHGRDK